jgi:hypothetical protein
MLSMKAFEGRNDHRIPASAGVTGRGLAQAIPLFAWTAYVFVELTGNGGGKTRHGSAGVRRLHLALRRPCRVPALVRPAITGPGQRLVSAARQMQTSVLLAKAWLA